MRRVSVVGVVSTAEGRTVLIRDAAGAEFDVHWSDVTTVTRANGTRLTQFDVRVGQIVDVLWVIRNARRMALSIIINE